MFFEWTSAHIYVRVRSVLTFARLLLSLCSQAARLLLSAHGGLVDCADCTVGLLSRGVAVATAAAASTTEHSLIALIRPSLDEIFLSSIVPSWRPEEV